MFSAQNPLRMTLSHPRISRRRLTPGPRPITATNGIGSVPSVWSRWAASARVMSCAWASNVGSPAHAAVLAIGPEALAKMQEAFEAAMRREELSSPGGMSRADVLFAIGQR